MNLIPNASVQKTVKYLHIVLKGPKHKFVNPNNKTLTVTGFQLVTEITSIYTHITVNETVLPLKYLSHNIDPNNSDDIINIMIWFDVSSVGKRGNFIYGLSQDIVTNFGAEIKCYCYTQKEFIDLIFYGFKENNVIGLGYSLDDHLTNNLTYVKKHL